jgi:hypothetical protein
LHGAGAQQSFLRLKNDFLAQGSQQVLQLITVVQQGAGWQQGFGWQQDVLHESQQSFLRKQARSRSIRLGLSQQMSQHDPQPAPHGAAAWTGWAAGAAGAAASAPASQAVVTSTKAAFTSYPPKEKDYGSRPWPQWQGLPSAGSLLACAFQVVTPTGILAPAGEGAAWLPDHICRQPGLPSLSSFTQNPPAPRFPLLTAPSTGLTRSGKAPRVGQAGFSASQAVKVRHV